MSESENSSEDSGFRVASIRSGTLVVLNKGEKDGVKLNQRFLLFGMGPEIFDPESKKSLGFLEEVRGTGKVIHVQESMSTIESDTKEPGQIFTTRPNFFGLSTAVVEERTPSTTVPFRDPKVGDFAKPIPPQPTLGSISGLSS
jgi:hypothetical protein